MQHKFLANFLSLQNSLIWKQLTIFWDIWREHLDKDYSLVANLIYTLKDFAMQIRPHV